MKIWLHFWRQIPLLQQSKQQMMQLCSYLQTSNFFSSFLFLSSFQHFLTIFSKFILLLADSHWLPQQQPLVAASGMPYVSIFTFEPCQGQLLIQGYILAQHCKIALFFLFSWLPVCFSAVGYFSFLTYLLDNLMFIFNF